jgi:dihydropteroate synthase
MREHIHFVTGRLAEFSLREVLAPIAGQLGFDYSVDVLGITVAALMTTDWVAPRVRVPPGASRVILPGYCQGELAIVQQAAGVTVERGPRDLRRLGEYLSAAPLAKEYGSFDIQILAEINHAPQFTLDELMRQATRLREDGADLIDIGCIPGSTWESVGEAVRALVSAGHRIAIDSMNGREVELAVAAGAELVLSVNSENRHRAMEWGARVVVVPDDPGTLAGMQETIEFLAERGVPLLVDPILEPIGFGFAASLGRYLDTRRRYPDAEMLMGIGNLTELTDADSAPINVLLLAFCQELGIRHVLTTQVINWAKSSVRECDLARRLVYHAQTQHTLPKHVEPRLVLLRDPDVTPFGWQALERLAGEVKDPNFRLFAEEGQLHAISAGVRASDTDPFALFAKCQRQSERTIDANHAFYLGYELSKAVTALTLDKEYRQDEALNWGFLTRSESHCRLPRDKAPGSDSEP